MAIKKLRETQPKKPYRMVSGWAGQPVYKENVSMKMMSVIAVTPKEGVADEITDLIVESRKDGVEGLDSYNIVHTHEDQLLVVNEWASMDDFMNYVNGPHNMIELIEHLCERFDEENVCKAYSGTIRYQHKQ